MYKTSVGNINTELLGKALQSLACNIGAEIGNKVKDYYGNDLAVAFSLKSKGLPNGIGFSVQNNTLMVHGDAYGSRNEWDRTKTLVENYVKAYKVAQQARISHPQAQINTRIHDREVILEVVTP